MGGRVVAVRCPMFNDSMYDPDPLYLSQEEAREWDLPENTSEVFLVGGWVGSGGLVTRDVNGQFKYNGKAA